MKIVVIQEEIIQTDITPKELTERWKRLEQLPGIDEVVIEVPAHYPNIEQLHTYIGDADAVFGLWIGPDNMNEAFLSLRRIYWGFRWLHCSSNRRKIRIGHN